MQKFITLTILLLGVAALGHCGSYGSGAANAIRELSQATGHNVAGYINGEINSGHAVSPISKVSTRTSYVPVGSVFIGGHAGPAIAHAHAAPGPHFGPLHGPHHGPHHGLHHGSHHGLHHGPHHGPHHGAPFPPPPPPFGPHHGPHPASRIPVITNVIPGAITYKQYNSPPEYSSGHLPIQYDDAVAKVHIPSGPAHGFSHGHGSHGHGSHGIGASY